MKSKKSLLPVLALLGLLIFAGLIYSAGLSGIYLLDDAENLQHLQNYSSGDNWRDYLGVALSQFSGATRILPMFSFALQYAAWPNHPAQMIAVNIGIHLANGVLVFLLCRKLIKLADITQGMWVAWIATAIWLLSPIQVSGTLYIIQRINQFAAFFIFVGLIAYLHGRSIANVSNRLALLWMTVGLVVGGALAVLSKENGVLMPLLILVIEGTLLRSTPWPTGGRVWRWCLLYLPLMFIFAFIVWRFDSMIGHYVRPFTIPERFLTECRILFDYLRVIFVPRAAGLGLFHDDERVAQWVSGDIFYLVLVLILGILAWSFRRRFPIAAFGVLWFFAGHILESTFIPLELYFEHRNYLPLFGLAFSMSCLSVWAVGKATGIIRAVLIFFFVSWLALMCLATWQQTSLWGNPPALAEVAENEHPNSIRAILFQAGMLNYLGFKEAAGRRMLRITEHPNSHPEYYPEWLFMGCDGHMQNLPKVENIVIALRNMKRSVDTVNGLAKLADAFDEGKCAGISLESVLKITYALKENPEYSSSYYKLEVLTGRYLLASGKFDEAAARFEKVASNTGQIEPAFLQVKALHAAKKFKKARNVLDGIERLISTQGLQGYPYRHTLAFWREQVSE
ncbi:tetratricopeptide repeat protein [Sulfurirhabdus autotrophica]|uniref:Tetratricopeptide repeat protein n=1 Tax=Sulfurirhabdus autotrophica TaxID=1706046 RepID=A0A4R3XUR4_9PROT|nr:tetratricopeptide repeat protein [Sulfurirhabdus autotrophica]TCV79096.1 hypothetical protein EDC63_1363 [Sulfurirhabdus autotrophica]